MVDLVIIYLYRDKKKLIEEQLLQAVVIMNSAFKSGKNIIQALTIVKNEYNVDEIYGTIFDNF